MLPETSVHKKSAYLFSGLLFRLGVLALVGEVAFYKLAHVGGQLGFATLQSIQALVPLTATL